jgi:hypothetical protein
VYIVAIGWLYVTLLVAATERSLVAAAFSFLFYGLLPCALLIWLGGSRARRERQRLLADQRAHKDDTADSQSDQ